MRGEKGPLAARPDELIYTGCYAPVDLHRMLESPDRALQIRSLPAAQLFFGLHGLEPREIQLLLPHLSGDQWGGVLDLGIWSRDRMKIGDFLEWQKHVLEADLSVARKLLWAGGFEPFELTFKRNLRIFPQIAEDESEGEPKAGQEWLETPDGEYVIVLPSNADRAQLLRSLILRLYEIDAEATRRCLSSCRARTSIEIEETAYQEKRRRLETLGFEDYFDAVEVYAPLSLNSSLPLKKWESTPDLSTLLMRLPTASGNPWLFLQAFSQLSDSQEMPLLVEELFFVCNKLLSADGVSPAKPARVKQGIRKAISGINLGLDCWARAELGRATEGIRRHYLQSFFQIGYGQLLGLQKRARRIGPGAGKVQPGSFREAVLEGLKLRYPLLTRKAKGKVLRRFFHARSEIDKVETLLSHIEGAVQP